MIRTKYLLFSMMLSLFYFTAHAEDLFVSEDPGNSHRTTEISTFKITVPETSNVRKYIDFHSFKQPLRIESFGRFKRYFMRVNGRLVNIPEGEEWSLLSNHKKVKVYPDKSFSVMYELSGRNSTLYLALIGPAGELTLDPIQITIDESLGDVKATSPKKIEDIKKGKPAKRFFMAPGFSLTSIRHEESSVNPYTSIAMTVKASANYMLKPGVWDLGITTFFTLFHLTQSSPDNARYFGYNTRIGYIFPQVKDPWRFSLYAGYYYTTMFVSTSAFGFKNMAGPQLYPSIRRVFNNQRALALYMKYSPVTNQLSLLTLANREVATGIAYVVPKDKYNLYFSTDVSDLRIGIEGVDYHTQTVSLGVGVGF